MILGISFKVNSVLFNKDSNSLQTSSALIRHTLPPTEVMLTLIEKEKELVSPFGMMARRNTLSIIMMNSMESV
jgi:hypothetical protein